MLTRLLLSSSPKSGHFSDVVEQMELKSNLSVAHNSKVDINNQ